MSKTCEVLMQKELFLDSDVVNCVNAVLDAQISSETILPQDGFSVDFEHIVFIFSEST